MVAVADFFEASALPASTAPPADAALASRIEKFSEFASRNGPSFVQLMQQKQQNNPEFSFLSGGEGSDYYSWLLFSKVSSSAGAQSMTRRQLLSLKSCSAQGATSDAGAECSMTCTPPCRGWGRGSSTGACSAAQHPTRRGCSGAAACGSRGSGTGRSAALPAARRGDQLPDPAVGADWQQGQVSSAPGPLACRLPAAGRAACAEPCPAQCPANHVGLHWRWRWS